MNDEDPYGFIEGFRLASVESLIDSFNKETKKRGWVSARGDFLSALREEFLRREFDCTSFINGPSMSLRHPIRLEGNRLIQIESDAGFQHGIVSIE